MEEFENDTVYVDQGRIIGPKAGLTFRVFEEDDKLFNDQLQLYIKNKDYRYVATALREEPERLNTRTRNLLAGILDKISKTKPAHRPKKTGPSTTDIETASLIREFETLKASGKRVGEIHKILSNKPGKAMSIETVKSKLKEAKYIKWGGQLVSPSEYAALLIWKSGKNKQTK